MRFEISEGVFIDVTADSQLAHILTVVESAKAHIDFLSTHSYDEKDGFEYSVLSRLVDETWNTEFHELVYSTYCEVGIAEDVAYRNRYESEFLEYASHKGEDDFDWDFYSDWHKDIYGYRPRG